MSRAQMPGNRGLCRGGLSHLLLRQGLPSAMFASPQTRLMASVVAPPRSFCVPVTQQGLLVRVLRDYQTLCVWGMDWAGHPRSWIKRLHNWADSSTECALIEALRMAAYAGKNARDNSLEARCESRNTDPRLAQPRNAKGVE
jgi:hypothetical protein